MRSERGSSVLNFIGFLFVLAVAFSMGKEVQLRGDFEGLDRVLETACSTDAKATGQVLVSATRLYRCTYLRDMTEDEVAEHKRQREALIRDEDEKAPDK